ncbi:MAG: DoxX family protein [Acidimicrobiales bacterium]
MDKISLVGFAGVDALDGWQPALRGGLALMLVLTASAHFASRRAELIAMVPRRLPAPAALVTATGVLEFAAAAGLLFHTTAAFAAVGLGLLLVAMFPANVRADRAGLTLGGKAVSRLRPRTAIQAAFLLAAVAAI